MVYRCKAYHTRYTNGTIKMYKPGEYIEPTKFELASFKGKFELVEQPPVTEVEAMAESYEETATLDEKLLEAKQKIRDIIDAADEWEDDVVEDAKKLYAKNPQNDKTKQTLLDSITEFLVELGEVETVEE